MIRDVDVDGNDSLDFTEFLGLMGKMEWVRWNYIALAKYSTRPEPKSMEGLFIIIREMETMSTNTPGMSTGKRQLGYLSQGQPGYVNREGGSPQGLNHGK